MLCDTLEIRWFFESLDPREVLRLFKSISGFDPVAEVARNDQYLHLPLSDTIGIKLREGRMEHKWLRQTLPGIETEPPLNSFGCWRKWSAPVDNETLAPGSENWITVRKKRWTSPWKMSDSRASPVEAKTERKNRCDVELARVELERPDSFDALVNWTLCFESEGPERQHLLESVLRNFCAVGLKKLLQNQQTMDYPTWLRRSANP